MHFTHLPTFKWMFLFMYCKPQIVVHQHNSQGHDLNKTEPWDMYMYPCFMPVAGRDKLIITPHLHDLMQAWNNINMLIVKIYVASSVLFTWSFAVMLNTMTSKHVFQLVHHVLMLLEDLYTHVAIMLPRIILKCISEPSNVIESLGARMRSSIFMWKHAFHFVWCIILKYWQMGRLYTPIGCIWPKKWHMKHIMNLLCAWQLHAVCYYPYPLVYPKWANPQW